MQHLHPLQVADFLGGKSAEKAAPADGGDEVLGEIGVYLRRYGNLRIEATARKSATS